MGHILEEGLLKINAISRSTLLCSVIFSPWSSVPGRLASGLKAALLESRRSSERSGGGNPLQGKI